MWLLPPDFPADAFDLPPGTWALPWYADEQHITALMRLLIAGEARIREWAPLPWAALESAAVDVPVRTGAAVVLRAPTELTADEIVPQTRSLPWPYVFWHSSRPAIEGEGAWLEREIKGALLTELHRSMLDPTHPLARFHIERLPLDLAASMVADPVDVVEIIQAAISHRLGHARDGLRREDYHYSLRWAAGRRLSNYLLRIRSELRVGAAKIIRHGGRHQEERGVFRQAAQAIQDVGLGILVGEDMALGPLARSAGDDATWAGVTDRDPALASIIQAQPNQRLALRNQLHHEANEHTYPPIMLPTLEILPIASPRRGDWIRSLLPVQTTPAGWLDASTLLTHIFQFPRQSVDINSMAQALRLLTLEHAKTYHEQRLYELLELLIEFVIPVGSVALENCRARSTELSRVLARSATEASALEALDVLLIEHELIHRPSVWTLRELEEEAAARSPANSWIDAAWGNIAAEVARLQGRSIKALALFDEASHRWAAKERKEEGGWFQSRISAACAAVEAMQPDRASQTLDLLDKELEEWTSLTTHAMGPLVRAFTAQQRADSSDTVLEALQCSISRFHALTDVQGELVARAALAEHRLCQGDFDARIELQRIHTEQENIRDWRGQTHTKLLLGDVAVLDSRIDEARRAYHDALRLSELTGNRLAEGLGYHKLARLEARIHRYDGAAFFEHEALALETSIGHTDLAKHTENSISELEGLQASTLARD